MDGSLRISSSNKTSAVVLLLAACSLASADVETDFTGHLKGRLLGQAYPADSLLRDLAGSETADLEADLRLDGTVASGSMPRGSTRVATATVVV